MTSYTFENVTGDHSISAVFKPSWNPFTDVTESDWFYGAVRHAYEQNWILGLSLIHIWLSFCSTVSLTVMLPLESV